MSPPILQLDHLHVEFRLRRRRLLHAVRDVSLRIEPGETYGLVGESGSGKTTTGRAVLGLVRPSHGSIRVDGVELPDHQTLAHRRVVQAVFQDPYSSLNPRRTVGDVLAELVTRFDGRTGVAATRAVAELLERVGLPAEHAARHPHDLSGGQRQRVAIARALVPDPRLIICDEALSALDTSTQQRILGLLAELQAESGVAFLFIAHDLAVVRRFAHRVGVMYLGELVEEGPTERVYSSPGHPYTRSLLAAAPVPDPARQAERRAQRRRLHIVGEPPSPLDPPAGCAFHPRCPDVLDRCRHEPPATHDVEGGGHARCHLLDVAAPSPSRSAR